MAGTVGIDLTGIVMTGRLRKFDKAVYMVMEFNTKVFGCQIPTPYDRITAFILNLKNISLERNTMRFSPIS